MQRHKSVEKRNRTSKKANLSNRIDRSKLKTAIKHVVEAKDKSSAQTALNNAVSILDKSVKSGLIHQNKAANNKSRLYSVVQKLEK
jgi:small subunit ribosomal protein S20